MRVVFFALTGLLLNVSSARSGANSGGTLIVHAVDAIYTTDNTGYCGEPVPRSCETADTQAGGGGTHVWLVLAIFTEENNPRLRGVEFGVSYSAVSLVDSGTCGDFESAMPGWPQSGTGTRVVWTTNQTSRVVPVYWFAGYAYTATGADFQLAPHPIHGGHFGDDYIPAHLDDIAAYGSLGFGAPGSAPCPAARTFVLRPDGTGDCATIQDAIYLAAPGSVIELADGVYAGPGNRDIRTNGSQFTLRSVSGDPNACVIDCQGTAAENHRAFEMTYNEEHRPTIEGIKIVGGYAGEDFLYDNEGGAVKMHGGTSLLIRNCIFEGCFAEHAGGAIDASGSIELEDCDFIGNSCSGIFGGALYGGEIRMRRCRFIGNSAAGSGGALAITQSESWVEECVFADNSAGSGGGVFLSAAVATFSRCTWTGNDAFHGGALGLSGGKAALDHCTLADNVGAIASDVYCDNTVASLALRNSILSFGGAGPSIVCGGSEVRADSCDIYGHLGGDWPACLVDQSNTNGNFSSDPLFCDRSARDYHVDASSPCAPGNELGEGLVGAWPVGCGIVADADDPAIALDTSIQPPFAIPNPFRDLTEIRYTVDAPQSHGPLARPVLGQIFDPSGRLVRRLVQGTQPAGAYQTHWDGHDDAGRLAATGVYFFRLSIGERSETARLLRIR